MLHLTLFRLFRWYLGNCFPLKPLLPMHSISKASLTLPPVWNLRHKGSRNQYQRPQTSLAYCIFAITFISRLQLCSVLKTAIFVEREALKSSNEREGRHSRKRFENLKAASMFATSNEYSLLVINRNIYYFVTSYFSFRMTFPWLFYFFTMFRTILIAS